MEPLKLWLKNKHFAQSNFKERRVVWKEQVEEINQSIEASNQEKNQEKEKLINLKRSIQNTLDKNSRGRNKEGLQAAINQINTLILQTDYSLISTSRLAEISAERMTIANNFQLSETLAKGTKTALNKLGELVAAPTKQTKQKNTDTQKKQNEQLLSFPIATAKLRELGVDFETEKNLSALQETHDTPKEANTWLLFPKPESKDRSIYLKISDSKAVKLNGIKTDSNSVGPTTKQGYTFVMAKINGYTEIIGAKQSQETKDQLEQKKVEKSTDKNKTKPEIDELALKAYEESKFEDAIKLYKRAYDISKATAILYNIALIYDWKLNDPTNALKFYKDYISKKDADRQAKKRAENRISEIEKPKVGPETTESPTKDTPQAQVTKTPPAAQTEETIEVIGKRQKAFELNPPEVSLDRIHDTVRIVENSELADTLNHNPEDWNKLYDRLTYRELYNYRFEKNFGLSKTEAPQALLKAFQKGLNDQLQFEDLLATTNTPYKNYNNESYLAHMDQLMIESSETYEQLIERKRQQFQSENITASEGDIALMVNRSVPATKELYNAEQDKKFAELDAMQTLFNAGHDILTHLKKEDTLKQLAETKFESKEERKQKILDKIENTNNIKGWQTSINHEFPDAKDIEVGITNEALIQFKKNFDYKGVGIGQLIQLLSRAYTLNELIAQNKVAKTTQGDIIITALPDNFDPKNPKIQELAAAVGQETLGTKPEFGQVNAPTLEQSHAGRITSFRNSLSKDAEVKRAQILKQLLAADKRSKSGIVESSLQDIADLTTEVTLEDDQKHELIDEVITQTSPEAMANNLFDRPTVKEYQLFTIDRQGNKKINEKAYINYFNHLMEQGELVRARQKFQEKLDINVGEITEKPKAKYIEINQSPFDLSDAQIDALRLGYAHELIVEKHQQNKEYQEKIVDKERDQDTKIFLQALYKAGYPKDKPLPSRETIAAAIGVLFKRGDFKAIAAGVNLPLGEGFSLHIGADNIQGPQFGVNLTGQIYKDSETRIEGGAAINIPLGRVIFRETPAAPRPQLALGAKAMFETTEQWDTGLFATTILGVDLDDFKNSGLDVAAIGFAAEFNQDRARLEAFKRLKSKEGFQEIEAETDPQKRLEKIKAHRQFAQFNEKGKELPDADQLAIYEEWADQIAAQAEKQATPDCPITGVYAGFTVGIPPTIMLGFKIRIGDKIYFRPTRSERERIAKDLQGERLDSALDAISYQSAQGTQIETFESADFFIDKDGSIALREKSENGELTFNNNSALEKVKDQLQAQHLELIPAENGGLELRINNAELRNVRLQLDPTATDIQMRIDQTTGKTYLFGNLNKLIIDRSTFRYQRREQEGGANTFDVITISNKPDINPYEISQSSALFAEKRIVDNKRTQWEITKGANYNQFTNLRSFNPNEQNLPQTTSFFDTMAEKPEWTEIKALATILKSPINAPKARENWNDKITELFNQFKTQIENGNPNIADYNAIVELVNDKLGDEPEMNATEAAKLLTTFQDLYFSDLLEKAGNDAEKLNETFNENNHWIVEKVLIPEFEKAITRLGIDADARELALALKTKAQGKFTKMLSEYKPENGTLKDFLTAKAAENRTPHLLFKSGTAIRETGKKQQGLLSGMMVSDLEALGGLYLVDDIETNSDLEKVVTEIMLPRPSLTVEGLATPTALKLAAFEGTGAILGLDTYRKVVEYYNSENKEINDTNQAALEKFVNFTHRVIDGKEPKVTAVRAALYGTYFKCGNLSLAAREQFTYIHETRAEGGIYVIGGEQSIHEEKEVGRDTVEILAGAAVDTKQDKPAEKTTPKNPATRPNVRPKQPSGIPIEGSDPNPINRPAQGAR